MKLGMFSRFAAFPCLSLVILIAFFVSFEEKAGASIDLQGRSESVSDGNAPSCTPPLTEGFNDVSTLPTSGWVQINHSEPIGMGTWAQGNPLAYPAQSGAPEAYVNVGFDSGSGIATLSNWLLTPALRLQNGDSITFWTRTFTTVNFADRLQIRLSVNGYSTNVGTTSTDVGDFTTLLLDINPTYQLDGYPNFWTQYTATVTGAPSPILGRFAFRYFVENGGPGGNNSDGIGVDTVSVDSCLAAPSISGTVTYGNAIGAPTPRFVSNVTMTAAGSNNIVATTSFPAGTYSLSGFGSGAYTVTPTKTTGVSAISSFDAARVSQHAAGPPNPQLSGNQLIAADVSNNGLISSFDAGMIAKYVAGPPFLPPGTGLTATWKFLPASRNYATVTNALSGEDYIGLLMGEVSGNWTNSGARPASVRGPEREVTVTPLAPVTAPKRRFTVPLLISGAANSGIISYQFDLKFDPEVIRPIADPADLTGTASRDLKVVTNSHEPGVLRVVVYGPRAIEDDGVLLNLRFVAIGKPGESCPLNIENLEFNDGEPSASVIDREVRILPATQLAAEGF
jgi:hypothetical protein